MIFLYPKTEVFAEWPELNIIFNPKDNSFFVPKIHQKQKQKAQAL